jgi:hypothetical protein
MNGRAKARRSALLGANDWAGDIGRGFTTATIKVRHPEVTHVVKIQDFENWLKRGCNSPKDVVLKGRLRRMLGLPQ